MQKYNLEKLVLGTSDDHLCCLNENAFKGDLNQKKCVFIHTEVLPMYQKLKLFAKSSDIELRIISAYRSFDQQLKIWNQKLSGSRPVLDDFSRPLDISKMDAWQRIRSVLRWTALPGTSRHHWGTDFDIYDASAIPKSYSIKLIPSEYTGGIFNRLDTWLDSKDAESDDIRTKFFRPYGEDNGGVAPEPWHLSYKPIADIYYKKIDIGFLKRQISNSEIIERQTILQRLEEIVQTYVFN